MISLDTLTPFSPVSLLPTIINTMSQTTTVNSFAETLAEVLEESPRSQKAIAQATGIPEPHLSGMKGGERRCTPEYDLRLSRYFGTTEGFWLRLQLSSDLRMTKMRKGSLIAREVQPAA